jgi:hypothetical protein
VTAGDEVAKQAGEKATDVIVSKVAGHLTLWERVAVGGTIGCSVIGAFMLFSIFGIEQGDIGFSSAKLTSDEFITGVIVGALLVLMGMTASVIQRITLTKLQMRAYDESLAAAREMKKTAGEQFLVQAAQPAALPATPPVRQEGDE